ncbi:DoxX family membrane protein [Hymenobacter monticola]|uniref:DoxX family membrane protein n=2 Tax=Hymenobacter monticola TaxID=1705399 RepID=A0ABY4BF64_9BACT|nr:DoxX family membrane protein [Hymenobacter monticola]UOE36418.1 DoxX family membrane protein [Hymenobacter monticola]
MLNPTVPTNRLQTALRLLLGSLMVLAGVAHLTFARPDFQAQVPTWLPLNRDFVVLASGLVEVGLGLAMLFWRSRRVYVGLALALFYVLIFPGNISQYVNHINSLGMNSDGERFQRLFFQPVLILWALWSTGFWRAWR